MHRAGDTGRDKEVICMTNIMTRREWSAMADYCYLFETSKEGSGVHGSAWEMLWSEFQEKNSLWASAVQKADKAGLVLSSDICFKVLSDMDDE